MSTVQRDCAVEVLKGKQVDQAGVEKLAKVVPLLLKLLKHIGSPFLKASVKMGDGICFVVDIRIEQEDA